MKHVIVKHGHATIDITHDGYDDRDIYVDANSDDEPVDTGKLKKIVQRIWRFVKMVATALL
jgi:hypothetical protein